MKRLLLGLLVIVMCAVPIQAQEAFKSYAAWVLGTQEQLWARIGTDHADGQVGVFGTYVENTADEEDRWGLGVYGTYDLLATDLGLVGLPDVPSKAYIGVLLGPMFGPEDVDVFGALVAGVMLGPVVVEGQWQPGKDLWKPFPELQDDWKLGVGVIVTFGGDGAKLGP